MKKLLNKYRHLHILLLSIAAITLFESCSSSDSGINTDDPEKAFAIGKRNFDKGEYLDAIDNFSFIKVKFPGSAVSDKAEFYLAESYFFQKEYLLAAYEYETLQKNFGLSLYIPDSKYRLGMCYYYLSPEPALDQEFTHYAISELTNFIDQYPNDKNTADAEKKLQDLRNKLAFKDYKTGEIYMKMDDYKAAGIYFQNVYETYIDSDWADDAMVGHAEALIERKKYDEAKKVLDKFYKLFPKSKNKSKADKLKHSIPS